MPCVLILPPILTSIYAVNIDAFHRCFSEQIETTCKPGELNAGTRRNAPSKVKKNAQGSSDIAVPELDEDGNLQEQSNAVTGGSENESESEENEDEDDEQDSDFAGPKGRSRGRNGSTRGRAGRGKAGGGRSGRGRASAATKKGLGRRKTVGDADEDANVEGQDAAAEASRGKDDFSVEADNNLFSERCFE